MSDDKSHRGVSGGVWVLMIGLVARVTRPERKTETPVGKSYTLYSTSVSRSLQYYNNSELVHGNNIR